MKARAFMYVCRRILDPLLSSSAMGCHRALGMPPGANAFTPWRQSHASDFDANVLDVMYACMYILLKYQHVYIRRVGVNRLTLFFTFSLVAFNLLFFLYINRQGINDKLLNLDNTTHSKCDGTGGGCGSGFGLLLHAWNLWYRPSVLDCYASLLANILLWYYITHALYFSISILLLVEVISYTLPRLRLVYIGGCWACSL